MGGSGFGVAVYPPVMMTDERATPPDPAHADSERTALVRGLVLLAPGAEEMEVTITVDVLRRAGIEVQLAGLHGADAVTCSRGVRLLPDVSLDAVRDGYDVLVLPGGAGGAEQLAASARVGELLHDQWNRGGLVAAICAAPTVLLRHGIGLGLRVTSHPSVSAQLSGEFELATEPVVVSGNLITSRGPGTTFSFALTLVERLCGPETAARVAEPMMLPS